MHQLEQEKDRCLADVMREARALSDKFDHTRSIDHVHTSTDIRQDLVELGADDKRRNALRCVEEPRIEHDR